MHCTYSTGQTMMMCNFVNFSAYDNTDNSYDFRGTKNSVKITVTKVHKMVPLVSLIAN